MATQQIKDILNAEVPKPSFVLSPSVPAPLPSGVTVTRNGQDNVARTLDPYSGKFEHVPEDTPRVYGDDQSLLVEAAGRTNEVLDSTDFDTGNWDATSIGGVSDVTSILSGQDASEVTDASSGTGRGLKQSNLTGAASEQTISLIVERGNVDTWTIGVKNTTSSSWAARVKYDFSTGSTTVVTGSVVRKNSQTLTNGPNGSEVVRVVVTLDLTDGDSYLINFAPEDLATATGKKQILHHLQLETARNASSPIVTQGSAKTRAADDYVINVGDWFNPNEGTIIMEVTPKFYLAGGGFNIKNFLRAGTTNSNFEWTGSLGLQLRVRGSNKTIGVTPFSKAKVAASFDSGTSSTVFSVNGSSKVLNRSGFLSDMDNAGNLSFGNAVGTAFGSIVWVPRALPESTLNVLTT